MDLIDIVPNVEEGSDDELADNGSDIAVDEIFSDDDDEIESVNGDVGAEQNPDLGTSREALLGGMHDGRRRDTVL